MKMVFFYSKKAINSCFVCLEKKLAFQEKFRDVMKALAGAGNNFLLSNNFVN